MPNLIDYSFISAREGGSVTVGYVPASSTSNSGVTIATGFDMGGRNAADLAQLGLDQALIATLTPYLGLVKDAAVQALRNQPLTISTAQAMAIDQAVRQGEVTRLQSKYLAAPGNAAQVDFFDLPAQAQTVIASVAFQYGDLGTRTPKFWASVTAQQWTDAIAVLRNFGDAYTTRRNLEANLLQAMLDAAS